MLGIVLAACGGGSASESGEPARLVAGDAAASTPRGRQALAGTERHVGDGYVVWESARSGSWRIWIQELDGGGLRQLSPDEKNRNHCCAHVSPDGRNVTYLSFEGHGHEYPRDSLTGVLHVLGPDGSGDRVVAPAARTYFENRAAVWRTEDELIYIDGDGYTVRQSLASGEIDRLIEEPSPYHGWLVDRTLRHATAGNANFSPYDAARRRVSPRSERGGCQPYFSPDGRWGFWAAGAGGPINRLDLESGEVATILRKSDPRLPDGWGYLYFPMVSPDGSMLAWAASRNEHDHFSVNYEVFVAPIDPDTLELVGDPVRVTDHEGPDRFPDVYVAPLPLGRHAGVAPLEVRLEAPPGRGWSWELGDGATAEGRAIAHSYRQAGTYRVVARRGEEVVAGEVIVRAATPPRALEAALASGGRSIEVRFDEPVAAENARARLASGTEVTALEPAADGKALTVRLAQPLTGPDRLHLQHVTDRTTARLPLPDTPIPVRPPRWPSEEEGLVFLWQTGDAPNLVLDPATGTDRAATLEASGAVRLDHAWRMVLGDGGGFVASQELSTLARAGIQGTNEMSIELVVEPFSPGPEGATPLIASMWGQWPNVRVVQSGDRLELILRSTSRREGAYSRMELMPVPVGRASHVVITYAPGRLRAYVDGELTVDSDEIRGDFFHWEEQRLVFGGGEAPFWKGALEGVALYNRVLPPEEVVQNAARYRRLQEERPRVPRAMAEGRLVARSRTPTLAEITPYREALVVYEYAVERSLEGELPERVRVAHWAILDGESQPVVRREQGTASRLTLEPFDAQGQVEALYLSDTLGEAAGVPLYLSVAVWGGGGGGRGPGPPTLPQQNPGDAGQS